MFPAEANLQLMMRGIEAAQEPWRLSDVELSEWRALRETQTNWWNWFTGEALREEDRSQPSRDGKYPLKYPLQINPFGIAARLHNYALWGDVRDTSGLLVRTMVEKRAKVGDDVAQLVEDVLEDVDYENNMRAQDLDMGLAIQALGGMVMKVGWDPTDLMLPTGIRYEYFDPRMCWFRWRGNNYWNLTDAWVVQPISAEGARMYGVELASGKREGLYVEYWNRNEYWIKIDGEIAADEQGRPLREAHGFGFVPFIYVPHERVNSFHGLSIVNGLDGMVRELNARETDIGDAIREGIGQIVYGRNIRNAPTRKMLTSGQEYFDLGGARTKGESDPELIRLAAPQLPEGALNFTARLMENIRIMMYTPDITYGREESGTQRSGTTLRTRMWPLVSHIGTERSLWTTARNIRAEMALQILKLKGRAKVTDKHLGLRKIQRWAPVVPLDRAQMVDELIRRTQEGKISDELLVDQFGDAPDVQIELQRIREQEKAAKELEAKQMAAKNPLPNDGMAGGNAPEQMMKKMATSDAGTREPKV